MAETETGLHKHMSSVDGVVLYMTAVLGQSLIVLPSLTARQAGPWSILIWVILAFVSYPIASIMAELGARYPSPGGVITFISHALGEQIGDLTGMLYLTAMLVGSPTSAFFFVEYLRTIIPFPPSADLFVGAGYLMLLCAINAFDVRVIMRFQRWIFLASIGIVVTGIFFVFGHISVPQLTNTHGYTLSGVFTTMLLAFFALVGWENATFSSAEFRNPRALVTSLRISAALVGLLFVGMSVSVVGALSRTTLAHSDTSITDLLQVSFGPRVIPLASIITLIILFSLSVTWTRSAARLVLSMARSGALPNVLAKTHPQSGSPRYALLALGTAWIISLLCFALMRLHIETYMQLSSANFLITYVFIFAAAWRLLFKSRYLVWLIIATVVIAALVITSLPSLWYAGVSTGVFLLIMKARQWQTTSAKAKHALTESS